MLNCLLEFLCGAHSLPVQPARPLEISIKGRSKLCLNFSLTLTGMLDLAETILGSRQMLERAFNRAAILPLNAGYFRQPIIYLLQTRRRKLQLFRKVTQRERKVLENGARGLQSFQVVSKARFVFP